MRGTLAVALAVATGACVGGSGSREAHPPESTGSTDGQHSAGTGGVSLCIVENGELKAVAAVVDTTTGDTLVNGRRLRDAYPVTLPPYARDAPWLAREIIEVNGRRYAPYGPPRVIQPELLTRVGEFRGVPVFAETALAKEGQGGIFVPIRPGCEFQPHVANVHGI